MCHGGPLYGICRLRVVCRWDRVFDWRLGPYGICRLRIVCRWGIKVNGSADMVSASEKSKKSIAHAWRPAPSSNQIFGSTHILCRRSTTASRLSFLPNSLSQNSGESDNYVQN